MTRREILTRAGQHLGDIDEGFLLNILNPAFDDVLEELASWRAIAALRKTATFDVELNRRDYDVREVTQLPIHLPMKIHSITVYAWGPSHAEISFQSEEEFRALRLSQGEDARGKWKAWTLATPALLRVTPPAGEEEDGAVAEVVFDAPPAVVTLDDDLTEIHREHIHIIVHGLKAKAAPFKEEWRPMAELEWTRFLEGRSVMWGQRFNSSSKRITANDF